jgi:phage/conjugal plasmid C-4 type zinc finger TraR family protein
MDDGDRAQQREEFIRGAALSATRLKVTTALARAGAADCVDCDDPIPEDRRKALPSAKRCVGCQEDFEKRTRG